MSSNPQELKFPSASMLARQLQPRILRSAAIFALLISSSAAQTRSRQQPPLSHGRSGVSNHKAAQQKLTPISQPEDPRREIEKLLSDEKLAIDSGDTARVQSAATALLAVSIRQLADVRILQRKYPDGISLFNTSLSFKDNPSTRLKLGVAQMRAGDFSSAVREADKLIAINPSDSDAWKLKGNALASAGEYEKAITALRQVLNIKGDGATAYALAICYIRTKQADKARFVFEDMARNLGDTPSLHILIGHAFRDSGDIDQAIAEY